jgi:mercuric ion binding protein
MSIMSHAVLATEKIVTLAIDNMTCMMCPITVKKSLQKVKGVDKVKVSFKNKTAIVTYDDEKTSKDRLVKATTNAGYPASVKKTLEIKND